MRILLQRQWSFSSQIPGCLPPACPLSLPTTISSHRTPPQDAVLLTPALCMGSHQPPTLTESKNIKPGPICRPTDERRCALDFRGDWQPVKAVRRGTCYPIPPHFRSPSQPQDPGSQNKPLLWKGLAPPPTWGRTHKMPHPPAGRLGLHPPPRVQLGPFALSPDCEPGHGVTAGTAPGTPLSMETDSSPAPGMATAGHLLLQFRLPGTLSPGAMWPTFPSPSHLCSGDVGTK